MATALSILQGFNNDYLQGLSEGALTTALEAAWEEVSVDAYGATANRAAACLAAHDLLMENIANSSSSGASGQALQVLEKQVGKRREKYAASSSASSTGTYSDSELDQTLYGQRFKRLRSQVSFGMCSTGDFFND